MSEKKKPELKILPGVETSDDPFDPRNVRLSAGEIVAGQKTLLKIDVRRPEKTEFIRANPDPDLCITTLLLPFDREFHLVAANMRGEVAEAMPYELRLCMNRGGAAFWWPIRLPGEDGKPNRWWDSARLLAKHAENHWTRCLSDRAANMYTPITATITIPEPAWPKHTVAELLRLGFAQQVIDSHDAHVLKILRGAV